ncbi:MAG TPA: hypothetical protein VFZ28_19420 [Burkholderiaceae bacterium]|nr:hypothetical protein [Burkholderiaceae bacterium]
MRALLWLAFALVLVVCLCSAALRLSGAAGCTPAPECLAPAGGAVAAAGPPADAAPGWQRALRLTHRITASLAGLVFLFIVAFGFARWSIGERVAGLSLLVLTLALALVGRITPSPSAAVALTNLLGGQLLLAALAWLLAPRAAPGARWLGWPLFAAALLLAATGSLAGLYAVARTGWLTGHAVLGVAVAAVLAAAAWRLRRARGASGATLAATATAVAAAAAGVLGLVLLQPAAPWPAALAHSAGGGLVLAGCAALWRASRR